MPRRIVRFVMYRHQKPSIELHRSTNVESNTGLIALHRSPPFLVKSDPEFQRHNHSTDGECLTTFVLEVEAEEGSWQELITYACAVVGAEVTDADIAS